jgi:AcrR family transcriptional regulator
MAKGTAFRILERALELFKSNGYASTTINDICQAVGVTKRTFYYYFSSKDQLIKDFFENPTELSTQTMRLLATSDNSWKKLWAVLEPGVNWRIKAGTVLMSQFIITNIQNSYDVFLAPYWLELENIYTGIIQNGMQSGHFQIFGDPALVYDNIKSIIIGVCLRWCSTQDDFDATNTIKKSIISLLGVRKDLLE